MEPQFRILRRPCTVQRETPKLLERPTTCKTLEQREADYAAARKRIMGSTSQLEGENIEQLDSLDVTQSTSVTESCNPGSLEDSSLVDSSLRSVKSSPDFENMKTSPQSMNQVCPASNTKQSVAVVNVGKKLQQKTPSFSRQISRNINNATNTLPFSHSIRISQNVPFINNNNNSSSNNSSNTGLLPTPPNFQYPQTGSNVGVQYTPSTALSFLQQFNLLHQHYQAMNDAQPPLVSYSPCSTNSLTALNLPSFSQSSMNQK